MSGSLRLAADDLTGALDAAAPFAGEGAPVAVFRDAARAAVHRGAWALDAATRGGGLARAGEAARQIAPALAAGLAFRKIDSLLRGHVAAEIAATVEAGSFPSAVIAPAFPAQGRVTRRGRQFARNADGAWNAVDLDLSAALSALGLDVRVLANAAGIAGSGTFLCDAETDSDLQAIASAGLRLAGPVLWCGTSGLARALAGRTPSLRALPRGPVLGVIGSRHGVSAAEIERLRQRHPEAVFAAADAELVGIAAAKAEQRLEAGQSSLLSLALPTLPPDQAKRVLYDLAAKSAVLIPGAVYASGGDTLAALMEATGAERLDVEGEVAPGVPLSRIAGGHWDGIPIVSKSGAFAASDVLSRLFEPTEEKRRAQA